MPVDPVANVPSTSVIAYNGDSSRGWNDPPTFAFSGQKGGASRPRIDLRKRVSHHQALHGTNSPPNPPTTPTTSSYTGGTEVSDRMASLSLHSSSRIATGNTSPHSLSTTPPLQPKMSHIPHDATPSVPLYTQPTTHSFPTHDTRSHSLPSVLMPSPSPVPTFSPNMTSSTSLNTGITPDVVRSPSPVPTTDGPTHLGQPLFAIKDHSFEPVKTHNESGVRSTADLGDDLDDHTHGSQHPEIFHPTPYPVANGLHTSTTSMPNVPSMPIHIAQSQGLNNVPPTCPPVNHTTPPLTTSHNHRHVSPIPTTTHMVSSQPGIPSATTFHGGIGHGTSSYHPPSISPSLPVRHFTPATSNPPSHPHVGHVTPPLLVTASLPPFPAGHRTPTPPNPSTLVAPGSLSTGSTPRCLSPEQNGVDDGSSDLSNEEGLKATMDALDDVIKKYHLKKRDCDDIAKRLKVMSKMWMDGKLGKTVKTRMIKLAYALDDGRGEDAHHIHVSIIVDHVTEVNQWIVAVKRLISVVRHQSQRAASS